jgi:predicted amidohydrolase
MLYGAEREAFTPGRSMLVTRLAGVLVGPMICFDAEFPEPARALARAGAELFVTASANMDPYREDHELATRARALDNRTPHAYANMVGAVGALRFCGGSRCIDRDGRVIAELPPAGEAVIAATMALGPPDDGSVDYLRCLPDDLDAVVATARAPRQ